MILGLAIVFISFVALLVASFCSTEARARVLGRSAKTWIVDFSGLIVQGLAVPLVQTLALAPLWERTVPSLKGAIAVPWWASFLMSFVLIDYVYYWNHRMLHLPLFWRWHRLHHSAQEIDIFATARNSLLTPLLIVYLWINSIFVFALGDATPFLVASSVGAALDLWRHSGFSVNENGTLFRCLSPWLILPQHHARHHAPDEREVRSASNFGANLNWWDGIHGTFDDRLETREVTVRSQKAINIDGRLQELLWPKREGSL
jgi:sterol desaturase/sphingolipid hydroxylase (fatty acid hydroxylase superfamily)